MRDPRLSPRCKWIPQSSGSLRGVRWFDIAVSEQQIGSIFKSQLQIGSLETSVGGPTFKCHGVQVWPLNMGPLGSPETSASKYLTERNKPENVRICLRGF
jgi:hypothetical protein